MSVGPSLVELGKQLRAKTVSATELARRSLATAEEWQPTVNAFISITHERAIEEARHVDEAIAQGLDLGPLMGIPYAVKDALSASGAPTTGGSPALQQHRIDVDADLIARLRDGGAVLIGKTNLHELGWGPEAGPVRNPIDPSLVAGGSSGGSAAAVCAGIVPIAIGTDAGGSIRIPAAFCGIVGFKPTFGRVSASGHLPTVWSLGEVGPLARAVADARLVFECIADPHVGRSTRSDEAPASGANLAVIPESVASAAATIAASVSAAIEQLGGGGWTIEERTLDDQGALAAWAVTYASELSTALRPWLADRIAHVSKELRTMIDLGDCVPAPTYLAAQRHRTRLFALVEAALEDVDALALPTVVTPPTAGEPDWGDESYVGNNRWLVPFNLTGHPAITLPLSPLGSGAALQLVGAVDGDEKLLAIAQQAEEILGIPRTSPEGSTVHDN